MLLRRWTLCALLAVTAAACGADDADRARLAATAADVDAAFAALDEAMPDEATLTRSDLPVHFRTFSDSLQAVRSRLGADSLAAPFADASARLDTLASLGLSYLYARQALMQDVFLMSSLTADLRRARVAARDGAEAPSREAARLAQAARSLRPSLRLHRAQIEGTAEDLRAQARRFNAAARDADLADTLRVAVSVGEDDYLVELADDLLAMDLRPQPPAE